MVVKCILRQKQRILEVQYQANVNNLLKSLIGVVG